MTAKHRRRNLVVGLRASGEQPWVIGQITAAAEGAAQVQLNNLKAH